MTNNLASKVREWVPLVGLGFTLGTVMGSEVWAPALVKYLIEKTYAPEQSRLIPEMVEKMDSLNSFFANYLGIESPYAAGTLMTALGTGMLIGGTYYAVKNLIKRSNLVATAQLNENGRKK